MLPSWMQLHPEGPSVKEVPTTSNAISTAIELN